MKYALDLSGIAAFECVCSFNATPLYGKVFRHWNNVTFVLSNRSLLCEQFIHLGVCLRQVQNLLQSEIST